MTDTHTMARIRALNREVEMLKSRIDKAVHYMTFITGKDEQEDYNTVLDILEGKSDD